VDDLVESEPGLWHLFPVPGPTSLTAWDLSCPEDFPSQPHWGKPGLWLGGHLEIQASDTWALEEVGSFRLRRSLFLSYLALPFTLDMHSGDKELPLASSGGSLRPPCYPSPVIPPLHTYTHCWVPGPWATSVWSTPVAWPAESGGTWDRSRV
jgi:hypothetical protein